MSVEAYRRKRNFSRTPEPRGSKSEAGQRFVVQKHAARRLHYDLRLELGGVLKSWAVTRGPSLVAGEKRLAVPTEDHPIQYVDFEGTVPAGEYGAGRMIVWDTGTWTTEGDPITQLAKGHLAFTLRGTKLTGGWHLVRIKSDRKAKRIQPPKENWLLIKSDDPAATGDDLLMSAPESVMSGRTIEDLEQPEAPAVRRTRLIRTSNAPAPLRKSKSVLPKNARAAPLPSFVAPALAALCDRPPKGGRWVHEVKFDGYRLLASIDRGRVRLRTRSGLEWTEKFRSLVPDLAQLACETALLDGEVVVESMDGLTSFSALQAELAAGRSERLTYYAFDILYVDGLDVRDAPWAERRSLLTRLISAGDGRVRLSTVFEDDGALLLKHACRLGLEGIVSKRRDAPYRSGRSDLWIKAKCVASGEFVIAGYVPSTVQKRAVGALVLGRLDGDRLVNVGRVGTGFSQRVAEELFARLDSARRSSPPFAAPLPNDAQRGVRWTAPELVARIEYRSWTGDGLLRHASFKGLSDDRKRDDPPSPEVPVKHRNSGPRGLAPQVRLTHEDRLLWPRDGVTKAGLADYLAEVWPFLALLATGRPLALVRCPGGIADACFFQKHRFAGIPASIRITPDPDDGKDMLSVDNVDGLLSLAQASVCEIHTWGSRLADLERPDMVTFDLDPAENTPWARVTEAAHDVHERLTAAGLAGFVKTSGGKGVHVVAPLTPRADWTAVKAFAERVARQMAADSPERYTAAMAESARPGKIFVDYLRNGRGATTVVAYSPRARPGATVSMPLAWDELTEAVRPDRFDIANAANRLLQMTVDPWADFFREARPLPAASPPRGERGRRERALSGDAPSPPRKALMPTHRGPNGSSAGRSSLEAKRVRPDTEAEQNEGRPGTQLKPRQRRRSGGRRRGDRTQ